MAKLRYPFDPAVLEAMPEKLAELYRELEISLLEEISAQLVNAGKSNTVTIQHIQALRSHGISLDEIKKAIRKTTKVSSTELNKMFEDVIGRNQEYYTQAISLADITVPETLVDSATVAAIVDQTHDEINNINRSMGFLVDAGRTMLPPAKAYQWALDNASMQIASGAVSYNKAIANATRQLADSGLKVVEYESGHVDQVDVAVRRAVMTGINQVNRQYDEEAMHEFRTDLVEVEAHAGARDTGVGFQNHKSWQGRIYRWAKFTEMYPGASKGKYKDFEKTCGLGDVQGILGANCRHSYHAFIEGVMGPTYTEEQLQNIDPPDFEYEEKTYTHYEATQKQREIERTVRKWKRIKAAATNPEDKQVAQIRIRRLNEKYKEFSEAANLRAQPERMKVYVPQGRGNGDVLPRGTATPAAVGPVVTNTPAHPDNPIYGGHDATTEWLASATPNSHNVTPVYEFVQDGVRYSVDGKSVKLGPSTDELKAAGVLENTLGGDVRLMPKVSGRYQNVGTPDFLFNGKRLDLKQISGTSQQIIEDRIHKSKHQADNFVFDITNSPLAPDEIYRQIEAMYYKPRCNFADVVMVIKEGKIIKIYQRNK